MIEVLNLFFICCILFLIYSFPSNKFVLNKLINKNIFLSINLNFLIITNIFFILSFFDVDLKYLFYFFLLISLLNLFFYDFSNVKKNKILLIFFVLYVVSYSLILSSSPMLEWDAAVNWIFKSINFKSGYSFKNLVNIPGVIEYPHLGTYLWAFTWKLSFIDNEYTGRIFFIFVYLISLFLVISEFKSKIIIKIFILFLILTISYDDILLSGYQEPLMFALCIIFVYLLKNKNFKNQNSLNLLFIFLCSNLILWTKNEGTIILIFLSTFIILKKEISIRYKTLLILSFIFLIVLKKYIFLVYFENFFIGWKGYQFLEFQNLIQPDILIRIPYLLFQVLITFFKYPVYIIFIIAIGLSMIKYKNSFIENLSFIIFFILNISLSVAIFYFTNDSNWLFHAKVGLDRILYQTSGIYWIFILGFINRTLILKNKN